MSARLKAMHRVARARKMLRDAALARVDALNADLKSLIERRDDCLRMIENDIVGGQGHGRLAGDALRSISMRMDAQRARIHRAEMAASAAIENATIAERLTVNVKRDERRAASRREWDDLIESMTARWSQASHKDDDLDLGLG